MREWLLLVACLAVACGNDPVAPTPPPPPACRTNNTATLYYQNQSRRGLTYDVWVDLGRVTTIGPSQTSSPHVVAAGVRHSVVFTITNVSTVACFITPIPVQCSTQTYFCDF